MELDAAVNRIDLDILMAKNPTQFGYHHGPIFPGENLAISSMNTQVCDVVVAAHGTMCGKTFLYRHIREQHLEFGITTPGPVRARPDEKRVGRNTIQRWVLGGGWRQARYFNEPRTLRPDALIMQYANCFELLAQRSADFRDLFGSEFHRPEMTWSRARQPPLFTAQL
ncbi:hypothetical protein MY4038_000905 [Beauveria bassiana]